MKKIETSINIKKIIIKYFDLFSIFFIIIHINFLKILWKYHPKFDMGFTQEDIKQMSEPARKIFMWYAYYDFDQKKYILCFDDQRFINHSKNNFNIESTTEMDIAARDIKQGEELLCDYNLFDKEYWKRHNIDESTLN